MTTRRTLLFVIAGVALLAAIIASNGAELKLIGSVQTTASSSGLRDWLSDYELAQYSAHVSEGSDGLLGFRLTNPAGHVAIKGSDGDTIEIDYTIHVYADTASQAQAYLDKCSVTSRVSNGRFEVSFNEPILRPRQIRAVYIDYGIAVPHGLALDLDMSHGDLELQHHQGSVTVAGRHGSASIYEIEGDLTVRHQHGSLSVYGVSGDVDLSKQHGDIDLAGVTGDLSVNSQHSGDSKLREIAGSVDLRAQHSEFRVTDVTGRVDVSAQHCSLSLIQVSGPVSVVSEHTTVYGEQIDGSISLDVEHHSTDLWRVKGPISIRSRHGDTSITLLDCPETAGGFFIDARTTYGVIRSSIGLTETEIGRHTTSAVGAYGEGAIPVTFEAEHGNLSLKMVEVRL